MELHTVYNAGTGLGILVNVTTAEFDRWYEHHADYRKVRSIEEVHPELRDLYDAVGDRPNAHFLVQA